MPFVCISNFVLCLVDVHAVMIVRLVQMNSWLNEVGVPKTNLHRSTTTQFSMWPGSDFVGSHPEVAERVDEIWHLYQSCRELPSVFIVLMIGLQSVSD
jgi:hypothetical protein